MTDRSAPTRVLIGVVGYTPVPTGYPLGPALFQRLEEETWPGVAVTIEDMSWGPVHIVQAMQAQNFHYDRAVLIGAMGNGDIPGSVTCGHWQGGALDPIAMQERMYEAVTGIISLDNLLIIGEHFGVWPREVATVEIELPPSCFGDIVIATRVRPSNDNWEETLKSVLGFQLEDMIQRVIRVTRQLAISGVGGDLPVDIRTAATLTPIQNFSTTNVV